MSAATEGQARPESPAGLLAMVRERRATENQAADVLELAASWADLHPPESIHSAAGFPVGSMGGEREEPIAGPGTPLVAEFCCAGLGAVLGVSTAAAKRLMGNALELRHRLPRLWKQVQAGVVPAWRARAVAEAITRHGLEVDPDPAQDPEHGWQQVDPRHATLDKGQVHFAGTLRLEAELDLADALDLDRTLTQGAATLKALGSGAGLDARRAMALGDRILTAPVPRPHPNGQLSVRITGWTPRPSPGC